MSPSHQAPIDHTAYSCPGCHRPANVCHVLPCLALEVAQAGGIRTVADWFRRCGYRVTVKGRDLILRPRLALGPEGHHATS